MLLLILVIFSEAGRDSLPVFKEDTLIVRGFYTNSYIFPEITPSDIERLPYFMEPDIAGYMTIYPYISSGGNFLFNNALYIKGQDPWEVSFYFNGIPLLSPFHLVSITSIPIYGMKRIEYYSLFHPPSLFNIQGNVFNITPLHKKNRVILQSPLNTTLSYADENLNITTRLFYPAFILKLISHGGLPLFMGDIYANYENRGFGFSGFYSDERANTEDTTSDYIFSRFQSYAGGINVRDFRVFYSHVKRFSQIERDTLFDFALSLIGASVSFSKSNHASLLEFKQDSNLLLKFFFVKNMKLKNSMYLNIAPVLYKHRERLFFNPDMEIMLKHTLKHTKISLSFKERSIYLTGKSPLYTTYIIPDTVISPCRTWEVNTGLKTGYRSFLFGIESYVAYHQNYRFYHTDRFFRLPDSSLYYGFWGYENNNLEERDSVVFFKGYKLRYGLNFKVDFLPCPDAYMELLMGTNISKINAVGYEFYPSYNTPFKLVLIGALQRKGWSIKSQFMYLSGMHYATRVINYGPFPVFSDRFYYYPLPSEFTFSMGASRSFRIKNINLETGISINRVSLKRGISYYLFPEYYNLPSLYIKMEF